MQQPFKKGGARSATSLEHQDGNQLGIASGSIFGMKKTIFNSMDYASLVLSSYATTH